MALEKDFLKKAKRDVKVPTEEIKAKIAADDPDDKTEIAELLGSALKEPEAKAEKPAEAVSTEKPAPAAEEKAEAAESTEKPAPKAKPEEKPEPDKVPVHLMVEQRKRADAAEKRQRELEAEQAALRLKLEEASKPKVEAKKEESDPEPDREKKPIEWSEWKTRELGRENAALREKVGKIEQGFNNITQRETEVRQQAEFSQSLSGLVEAAATGRIPERIPHIPDMKERFEFLRERQGKLNRRNGISDSPEMINIQTAAFFDTQIKQGNNIMQALADLADDWGYAPKAAEAPKAAPKTSIKDQQEREKAAKTSATMPGAAPKASSDEDMSSDKWLTMNPKERQQYKKAHPDFKLDRIMMAGEA